MFKISFLKKKGKQNKKLNKYKLKKKQLLTFSGIDFV